MMNEACVREEHNEYDVEMANKVFQQQREEERWENTFMNEESEEDGESH